MPLRGNVRGSMYGQPRETYAEFMQRTLREAAVSGQAGKQYAEAIQAGQEMPQAGIVPTVGEGLRELMAGGMSPGERLARRRQVTTGFQRATGQLAAGTARRGFAAPQSVAGAAMGRPARGLATGLSDLAAAEQKARLESIGRGTQVAAGLFQYPWEAEKARQTGAGKAAKMFTMARAYPRRRRGYGAAGRLA